jgi:DNA-binding GntR family transcriptional regulator
MTPVSSDLGALSRKHDAIRQHLRERILSGQYAPGDQIPERVVAEALGVSRVPGREALAHIERDGLVSTVLGAVRRCASSPWETC